MSRRTTVSSAPTTRGPHRSFSPKQPPPHSTHSLPRDVHTSHSTQQLHSPQRALPTTRRAQSTLPAIPLWLAASNPLPTTHFPPECTFYLANPWERSHLTPPPPRSCMNEEAINAAGNKPLQPLLKEIDSVQDLPSLTTYLAKMGRNDNGAFFAWYVDADSQHPDRRAVFVAPGGMTLPDKSYYTSNDADMLKHRSMEVSPPLLPLHLPLLPFHTPLLSPSSPLPLLSCRSPPSSPLTLPSSRPPPSLPLSPRLLSLSGPRRANNAGCSDYFDQVETITKLLVNAGVPEEEAKADALNVLALETRTAETTMAREEARGSHGLRLTREELKTRVRPRALQTTLVPSLCALFFQSESCSSLRRRPRLTGTPFSTGWRSLTRASTAARN